MDSACYDSTDNLIIGVRGGRIFKCDPSTGAVQSQADFAQPAFGLACCAWDSGSNRVFASVWNQPHFVNDAAFSVSSPKNIYRIIPSTLATELVIPFDSITGFLNETALWMSGPGAMVAVGGHIYGRMYYASNNAGSPKVSFFRFLASNFATNQFHNETDGGYANCAYANVGGDDVLYALDQSDQGFNWYDFTTSANNFGPTNGDTTKVMLAIAFAPVQQHLYVTDQAQFIYVYDTAGAFVSSINTGRSAFNGIQIRFNSNDGLLYAAGFADNTVVVITPSTNAFVVKTGFDLPVDFVFTPTKRFCVQQGGTPLKEIV